MCQFMKLWLNIITLFLSGSAAVFGCVTHHMNEESPHKTESKENTTVCLFSSEQFSGSPAERHTKLYNTCSPQQVTVREPQGLHLWMPSCAGTQSVLTEQTTFVLSAVGVEDFHVLNTCFCHFMNVNSKWQPSSTLSVAGAVTCVRDVGQIFSQNPKGCALVLSAAASTLPQWATPENTYLESKSTTQYCQQLTGTTESNTILSWGQQNKHCDGFSLLCCHFTFKYTI